VRGSDVLNIIERLEQETAEAANAMADAVPGMFDAIGAGKGVAARLQAFQDVRQAVITAGLREYEEAGR
jgi:hypothetical protein